MFHYTPTDKPYIVIGAGGHAKVVIDMLLASEAEVIAVTDRDAARHGTNVLGIPIAGDDSFIEKCNPDDAYLALGIGASGRDLIAALKLRTRITSAWEEKGFFFPGILHPDAIVSPYAAIGHGVQAMAGALINPDAKMSAHAIVNTGAIVEHDCTIGTGSHIAPGTVLGGGAQVGTHSYIALGSRVLQGIQIGDEVLVAAGAVVTTDIADGQRAAGIPAKAA